MSEKTRFGKLAKLGIGLGACVGLGAGAVIATRHHVRNTCQDFYARSHAVFCIPGLNNGFVPQDIARLDDEDLWMFSGYNTFPRRPSPLYLRSSDGTVRYLTVKLPDGSTYRGHGAAVAGAGAFVFLTVQDGYVVLHRDELVKACDGACVHAFARVPVELEPAFMIVQDGTLYIGEFYHPHAYPTPESHWVSLPDGSVNRALVYAHESDDQEPFGFAAQASAAYSIPDDIQGMCLTDDGHIVLSRAWGLGDASLLVYTTDRMQQQGTVVVDGREVPLHVLDGRCLEQKIITPPMAEGISFHDGLVYLANESASMRYLIGRACRGKNVYAVDVH